MREAFQIQLVLKRLLEKGRIVYKRAYCDWSNYRDAIREFHGQGIELIDIPQSKASGKNSADIHMVVDALDLCYAKDHIDIFALLVRRQRLLAAGLEAEGERQAGDRLRGEEFHLESAHRRLRRIHLLRRPGPRGAEGRRRCSGRQEGRRDKHGDKKQEAIDRLLKIVSSLELDYEPLWGSMVKQAIRRVHPDFNEGYYGYRNFSDLLEDAQTPGPDRVGARRGPRQLQDPAEERARKRTPGSVFGERPPRQRLLAALFLRRSRRST